jgi:regulator of RNase E activity RraB
MATKDDEFLKNEPVRANLRDNGDNCEAPRPIEHYAYFRTREAQESYRAVLISRGYQIDREDVEPDDDGRLAIVFSQVQVPVAIDAETAVLDERAVELNGEYDGWVTDVVRTRH